MTRFQAGIAAFWVIVLGLFFWQIYTAPSPPPPSAVPKVRQSQPFQSSLPVPQKPPNIYFSDMAVLADTPDQYHHTLQFRLVNASEDTAIKNIVIKVQPYRRGFMGSQDDGLPITPEDPLYTQTEIVTGGMLKPGENRLFRLEVRKEQDRFPGVAFDPSQYSWEMVPWPKQPAASTNSAPAPAQP